MLFKLVCENIMIENDELVINNLIDNIDESAIDQVIKGINKIIDKKKTLLNLIKKFNEENSFTSKKRIAKIIIVLFIALYGSEKTYKIVSNNRNELNHIVDILSNEVEISVDKIANYFDELAHGKKEKEINTDVKLNYNNAQLYTTSDLAKDTIKQYERLRLRAYKIKDDNKITVGWGHAEPIKTSKFRVGQKISKDVADKLFENDIKIAEDGVKRIFAEWSQNGNDVEITQGMFDAMVSIAFNAGVSGLRQSAFIQLIKNKNFEDAHNEIINTRNTGKFGGLNTRRAAEQNLYRM